MRALLLACAHALVLLARLPWRRLGWWAGARMRALSRVSRGTVRAHYVYDVVGGPVLDRRNACRYLPPCGGCDACCIAQAEHYGMTVHPIPVEVRP